VNVERQGVRLAPNVKLAELTHEFILIRRSEGTIIISVRHIPSLPVRAVTPTETSQRREPESCHLMGSS
jgi:hypothetical protein